LKHVGRIQVRLIKVLINKTNNTYYSSVTVPNTNIRTI